MDPKELRHRLQTAMAQAMGEGAAREEVAAALFGVAIAECIVLGRSREEIVWIAQTAEGNIRGSIGSA